MHALACRLRRAVPVLSLGDGPSLGVWAAEGVEDQLAKIEEHVVMLASQ